MQAAPFMTPNPQYNAEQILLRNQYKALFNSNFYNIIIEKTNNNIIIRNNYYELKLNIQALSMLTNTIFNSIDQAYEFIINIFNQNKYYIKEILSNKIILTIGIFDIMGNQKEIDLELIENFEDKNYLIKELFNNYIKLENNINYINNDNKLLKEENNNLKNEIYNLKQNYNNDINELKMQIMNYNNMINQIQQQLNQFNNIYQEINNIKNQINNNSEKARMINVIFRKSGDSNKEAFIIKCNPEDNIRKLIRQYRKKSHDYSFKRKFIFDAKNLKINLTISEAGLKNNSNIFVVEDNTYKKHTNFIISDDNDFYVNIKPYSYECTMISTIIEYLLEDTGLKSNNISNCYFNDGNFKIFNKNLTLKECGIQENSNIIIKLKNKYIDFISIIFQKCINEWNREPEKTVIKCLKTEKISSLISRFKAETFKENSYYSFLINSIEIDEANPLKFQLANWSVEDFELENNSKILYFEKDSLA